MWNKLRSIERDAPAPKIQIFSFLNEDGRPGGVQLVAIAFAFNLSVIKQGEVSLYWVWAPEYPKPPDED